MEITQKDLTDRELAWSESYLIHLQKVKASLEIGCPETSARQQGYEIYNRPHVKAYIEKRLEERTISAAETVKLVSDTALASLTDYYKPVLVPKSFPIKKGLSDVILERKSYLEREYKFCEKKGFSETEYDDFMQNLEMVKDQILRMEIELEENPLAYRIIDSEKELVEEMQLDIDALIADKERGKVKKIKYSKDGLEVEMYSSLDAAEKLMKMHGKYEKDNSQKQNEKQTIIINGKEIEF